MSETTADPSLLTIHEARVVNGVITLCEAAAYHREDFRQRPQEYGEDVRARVALGARLPAADYIRAAYTFEQATDRHRRKPPLA